MNTGPGLMKSSSAIWAVGLALLASATAGLPAGALPPAQEPTPVPPRTPAEGGMSQDALQLRTNTQAEAGEAGRIDVQSQVASAALPALHDQMSFPGNWGIVSQNYYEAPFFGLDTEAADDFVVPSADGSWTIESVEVLAFFRDGAGPVDSFVVRVYDSLGIVPGTMVYVSDEIVPIVTSAGGSNFQFTINLNTPAVLADGSYWISVVANMSGYSGDWMWHERTVQSGQPFAFKNPMGGWGEGCTSWCAGHGIEPDLNFRLLGWKGNPSKAVIPTGTIYDVVEHGTQPLVYASVPATNSVVVVNTDSESVVTGILVGSKPQGMAISPDSSTVYVALNGGSDIQLISTASNSVVDTFGPLTYSPKEIEYGGPGRLYVSGGPQGRILDPSDGNELGTFTATWSGYTLTISPDGNTLCAGAKGISPAGVACFDVSTDSAPLLIQSSGIGSNLHSIDISADDTRLYVASGAPYYIQALYLATLLPVGQFQTGAYPESAVDSPDGRVLFGSGGDSSWVWNTTTFLKRQILDSDEVVFLAAGRDNHTVYADHGNLVIYHFTSFKDVGWTHWALNFVEAIYAAGLTIGYPDGTYGPDNSVTRAEMAVFLKKGIHGSGYFPPAPNGSHPFSDLAGHWAEWWMEELYDEGLTVGYPEPGGGFTYRPENQVTRAEMAVFLLKAKHGSSYLPPAPTGGSFSDVAGHWAEAWIEQLKAEGITSGYPDGTFRPEANVTRAEMAVFLVQAFSLPMP